MKKTLYIYDEDSVSYIPYKKARLTKPYWVVIVFLFSTLLYIGTLLFLPSDVVQAYENKKMKQALEMVMERNVILAKQAVEINSRQLAFYKSLGIKIDLADTLTNITPTVLDSIEFWNPDSVLHKAEILNRQVSAYQRELEAQRIKLDYLPAVSPVDYEAVRRMPDDSTLKISMFGMRKHPKLNINKMHTGMDFAVPEGTPVWATADGVVSFVGTKSDGYGIQIQIKHTHTMSTLFGHMSRIAVRKGQKVERHQYIGKSGNTGMSSGAHLHYEVRVRDNEDAQFRAIDPLLNMKIVLDRKVRNNLSEEIPMLENFPVTP